MKTTSRLALGVVMGGVLASSQPGLAAEAAPAPVVPAAPAAAAAGPLPAKAFAELPFFADGDLSPDGTAIAGKMVMGGTQVIGVRYLFDKTLKPVSIGVPDTNELDWVRWVGNDHIVARIRALMPLGTAGNAYVTRLIAVDVHTGKVTKLLWDLGGQNGSDVVWTASDGTPELMVAAQGSIYLDENFYPTVYRLNLANGRKRTVQQARTGVFDWIADGAGVVRAGVGIADEGRTSRLLYRGAQPGAAFETIDRASSRARESVTAPILFLPGGDHAIVDQVSEDHIEGLYEMDMRTRERVRTVFEAPKGVEIDGIRVSDDRSRVLGVSLSTGADRVHWLDPAMAELQAAFDKSVAGRGITVSITSVNADRSAMLVRLDSASSPGALYYYSNDSGQMQRIAVFNATLKQTPMAPVSTVRYKARDGLEIEAVMTLPKGKPAKALPIVMLPHGGPWARDTVSWDYMAQYIANLGYAVMQPNFRGSTGYGAAFLRKGEGQMGLAMQDDITDGLRWAVAQGIADPARACIVGASYGGYAAMWGLAKDPELYCCGISISGVASLRREVNDFGNSYMRGKFTDDWKAMTPDFAAVSPLNAVARIKAPLLLIHGRKDVTVDVSHSDSMASRMRDAGKTVDYVSLPKADHYFTREADREAMLTAIGGWLAKYNP